MTIKELSSKDFSLQSDQLHRTLTCERYLNQGTRTYSKHSGYTELSSEFQPESLKPSFEVKGYHVFKKFVDIHSYDAPPSLQDRFVNGEHAVMYIHPEIDKKGLKEPHLEKLLVEAGSVTVSPTASSRAVAVLESLETDVPFYLKLHLPVRISRFNRRMGPRTVEHCVAMTRVLKTEIDLVKECPKFAILPDSIGVAFPTDDEDHLGWGYLVREMTPYPQSGETRQLIPTFSLYSRDNGHLPMLAVMIKASGEDPKDYVLNRIMFPIIDSWITVFKKTGFILECHGQNTLVELGRDGNPSRVVYRDLDNTYDPEFREKKG